MVRFPSNVHTYDFSICIEKVIQQYHSPSHYEWETSVFPFTEHSEQCILPLFNTCHVLQ